MLQPAQKQDQLGYLLSTLNRHIYLASMSLEIFNEGSEVDTQTWVCSVVVSRSLCMRKAPGSNPGRSRTFLLAY